MSSSTKNNNNKQQQQTTRKVREFYKQLQGAWDDKTKTAFTLWWRSQSKTQNAEFLETYIGAWTKSLYAYANKQRAQGFLERAPQKYISLLVFVLIAFHTRA